MLSLWPSCHKNVERIREGTALGTIYIVLNAFISFTWSPQICQFNYREKFYEAKLQEQQRELKQLQEERKKLIEIQEKIQALQKACPDLQVLRKFLCICLKKDI